MRTVEARKAFKFVERTIFVKRSNIAFQRIGGVENPRTAARRFLRFDRMGRAIGAEEKFGRAGHGGLAHRDAMLLALGDGQAISMGADAADQHCIAVNTDMLRGDRRGDICRRVGDKLRGFGGSNMLEHDFERGQALHQWRKRALDKHRLTIENIDIGIGDFAMGEEWHPDVLHPLQHRHNLCDIGDAMRAVGGGMRGVKFAGGEYALFMPARNFVRITRISEIGDHQRGEIYPFRDGGYYTLAIGNAVRDRHHGRGQVGHDNRAPKLPCGIRHHRLQHRSVAHMDVPVIRATDGEGGGHGDVLCKMFGAHLAESERLGEGGKAATNPLLMTRSLPYLCPMTKTFRDRAIIRLAATEAGEDIRAFLQGLVTQDMGLVRPGAPAWAALLTPQGKALFDFILWADGDDILIDCEEAQADALVKRLSIYRLRRKIAIARDDGIFVGWGDAPDGALQSASDPRLATLGTRSLLRDKGDSGDDAWRAHRLGLGVTEGVAELGQDKILWLECNAAELNGVSFTKGCYVGQENTARMNWRQKVNRRLVVVPLAQADEKRQTIAYPDLGLSVEHRRVETIDRATLPDWLAGALTDAP